MFEIDKRKFGAFVAELRKKQGYTQKELAERLYISDKAVSKWETGASIPDVPLLIPLAELLDVTVTELLECKRLQPVQTINAEQVEDIVKKAVAYSGELQNIPSLQKGKRIAVIASAILLGVLELAAYLASGATFLDMNLPLISWILGTVFGVYFWVFGRETLPVYFDENEISAYSDGFFRMNVPGLSFNNSNWPHILWVGRIWALGILLLHTPLCFLMSHLTNGLWESIGTVFIFPLTVGGFVVPMYVVGKKYE